MRIDELIRCAANGTLTVAELESASAALGASVHEVCDRFARELAEGYLRGIYSWEDGDSAMNYLYSIAYADPDFGLPEFAWRVFEAFDEGEYVHADESPQLDGKERTTALLLSLPQLQARA